MTSVSRDDDDQDEDDDSYEDKPIQWSDLIFLPFHPVFKIIVLFSVILKTLLGPIQSVHPIVYCSDVMDTNWFTSNLKYYYLYLGDLLYFTDTLLHIIHRQVIEKAMRREYLPKSAFFLILDMISLIPWFEIINSDVCPKVQLWPNVLAFIEFVIIYRVVEYFSLVTTHSFWKLLCGFSILTLICVNCICCFWLLLTVEGLCANCRNGIYDWRKFVMHKLNETDEGYTTYVYGYSYVLSFVVNIIYDETKPSTIVEYLFVIIFMICGYILDICVVLPKLFAESILSLRRICTYHPQIVKIVGETRRRNPVPDAHISVKNFYKLMWNKRNGITCIPPIISELPRYLRLDIRQDLVWPVFYHSPSFRKTSNPLKRWLCEFIRYDYKLPGEKIFAGLHCHTNLYYLKSGIVQLMSTDDGITPLISVTSGTIFGDISFFVPPLKRKVTVRCLTYCEVLYISRYDILKGLHKYPHDREEVIKLAQNRMKHARLLYTCKQHVKGLDIIEDEGIAWIKRRWWEISDAIANFRKKGINRPIDKHELPAEETIYHCAKYIGQLVLCSDAQLHTKSLFTKDAFPWLLSPDSTFVHVWQLIVLTTVFFVIILYPPNIVRYEMMNWFTFFKYWTDFIYATDLCISMFTSIAKHDKYETNFIGVMFARCKSLSFILDVLATIWIENIVVIIGIPEYYHASQFNRLIKVYMLFWSDLTPHNYNITSNPKHRIYCNMALMHFSFAYIVGHIVFMLSKYIPDLTVTYFFGLHPCGIAPKIRNDSKCDPADTDLFAIAIGWTFEQLFLEYLPHNLADIYGAMTVTYLGFLTYMFCRSRFIAFLYLKYREVINYQFFVTNLKKYYEHHKIHPDLMKRLNRYLDCHWKYYKGIDVMHPNLLKDEPYDIYWKVQGEVAEKIINQSLAFDGAESSLVRELAYAAKFLILPKSATLFLFGSTCKNVTWIIQGYVKIEYHNEEGELLKTFYGPGQMVSVTSVLLGQPSQRTYSSCTECEILYIKLEDFFNIIKRYPNEWSYFQNCIHEYRPLFQQLFQANVKKHKEYQEKIRDHILHRHGNKPLVRKEPTEQLGYEEDVLWSLLKSDYSLHPESDFIKYWMLFRAITVIVSIATASLQGGSGAVIKWPLTIISIFCDCVAYVDIMLKLFLPYYNEKGILIYSKRKCLWNYLSRGFLMDVIGALPVFEFFTLVMTKTMSNDQAMFMNTVCKFAHLYILTGYFNYIADAPSMNSGYLLIIKWQIVTILIMLGGSHYLINHCIEFTFDAKYKLIHMARRNSCWIPSYMILDKEPTVQQLHVLFAESINLAQSGLMKMNLGKFRIDRVNLGVGFTLFTFGILFWYVICYSLTILVLSSRGDTLYQHGVSQLKRFLQAERVDKKLIHHASAHFSYWWIRTKGINIQNLMNRRIGVVFRQDLSYYFFKKTFIALDTIINCGESLSRQLSSVCSQVYYLPSQEIVREMDLNPQVFIVHRGKVSISQGEEKLAVLTKGAIFGQLKGTVPRPIRISAIADGYTDILQIPVKQFHDIISDEVRETIAHNYQSEDDYMATKKRYHENPYNTVRYILRGRKTIKLPWMVLPMEARSRTWYSKWLAVAWLFGPFSSAVIVLILNTLPIDFRRNVIWILVALDLLHLTHFLSEFYTMELMVIGDKCINRVVGFRMLKNWMFYVDVLSLIFPMITLVTGDWTYQIARLLRLHLLYQFHKHFCRSFKSKAAPLVMKFIILFLLLHSMTCGWIYVGCRRTDFPVPVLDVPLDINKTIDYQEWQNPKDRQGGCARITRNFNYENQSRVSFLVPKSWQDDYVVALTFIILLHTHTVLDTVMPLSITEIYYKVFINFFIYLIDIWLMSVAVSAVYTTYRELYQYDYNVSNLISYLKHSGLSPVLLKAVMKYTKQLWRRQRGNWLPELAHQAPMCLREDLLSALYMYHIQTPPLFRLLPKYFARQLVARVQRIVVFPNKCIVQEGDIFSCIYFIHEGEVEKWFTDSNGEKKMTALLSSNGYFGFIPGLFPNTPFQFTYYARTVVDLVYLRLSDWQDLLNAFPDVKQKLYIGARQLKKDILK